MDSHSLGKERIIMDIKFFSTIESPTGDVTPKIKYDKGESDKAKKYLELEEKFFERIDIDEAKFEWEGDILSYQHVFRIDDMVDRGELTEEEGVKKLKKDIPEMRALSQMLGQTMPAVSLIVRYRGTDRYYPLQFLMCDHIGWPRSEEIYLTNDEFGALIQGVKNAVDKAIEENGGVGGGDKE